MDWKVLATAFVTVFVAELGDKTQLAAFGLAAGSSKWTVFIGASLALILSTGIAIAAAGFIERYVPLSMVKRGAGVLFIAIGLFLLIKQPTSGTDGGAGPQTEAPPAPEMDAQ